MSATLPFEVQCTHRAPRSRESQRRMGLALAIAAAVMLAEAVGGWMAHSLALLADAGHMLADVAALGLSVVVASLARRPATAERTFGLLRLEILAALVNGAALIAISIGIAIEAYRALPRPAGGAGRAAHGGSRRWAWRRTCAASAILHGGHAHSLNQRGAYLHIVGDLLGSVGALVGRCDHPHDRMGAGRSDHLDRDLAPHPRRRVAAGARERRRAARGGAGGTFALGTCTIGCVSVPGVTSVHDLHVWTVTSGVIAMSGHLVVQNPADNQRVLEAVQQRLAAMGIGHVTVQMEKDPTCDGDGRGRSRRTVP